MWYRALHASVDGSRGAPRWRSSNLERVYYNHNIVRYLLLCNGLEKFRAY